MSSNKFYVYERYRLDNNTCFYVGKGTGNRCSRIHRNSHHDRIADKYGFITVIIADNLTNEEATELEMERIDYYVFDLGYGIDINGYRNYDDNCYLTNMTFGGEGTLVPCSEERRNFMKEHNKGINSKLNKDDVEQIKLKYIDGISQKELSEIYNVKISTINKITSVKNWVWVREDLNEELLKIKEAKQSKSTKKQCKSTQELRQERNNKIINYFNEGLDIEEISIKENVTTKVVKNVLGSLYSDKLKQEKEELKAKCIKMRKDGYMVKDIAKILGLHRTTVTEYTKLIC